MKILAKEPTTTGKQALCEQERNKAHFTSNKLKGISEKGKRERKMCGEANSLVVTHNPHQKKGTPMSI